MEVRSYAVMLYSGPVSFFVSFCVLPSGALYYKLKPQQYLKETVSVFVYPPSQLKDLWEMINVFLKH